VTVYQPGMYAFVIRLSDPKGRFEDLVLRSNVNVDRPMSLDEVAQAIVTSAAGDYPNVPVLHVDDVTYRLHLKPR